MDYLRYFVEFIILFLGVYLYYRLIALKTFKKLDNKKKKELPEVRFFVSLFKINMRKVKYDVLANQIALITSFNLALTVVLVIELFDGILLKILVGFVGVLVTMFLGYNLLSIYYKKKGMIKDVQS